MRKIVLAAICVAVAAGITAGAVLAFRSTPQVHHHARPAAAAHAAGSAQACARLAASSLPIAAYDQLVIAKVSAIAGNGNATNSQVRTARADVAAEVRSACPQFAYLIKQEASGG